MRETRCVRREIRYLERHDLRCKLIGHDERHEVCHEGHKLKRYCDKLIEYDETYKVCDEGEKLIRYHVRHDLSHLHDVSHRHTLHQIDSTSFTSTRTDASPLLVLRNGMSVIRLTSYNKNFNLP